MTVNGSGRTIAVDGARLYVRERGEGPPVLLINGLGSNAEMWGAVEGRLAERARTIVYDMPGSGRSPTPHRPLSVSALAGLALGLLDELGHEEADVLGFSLGGIVAQQLAHAAPGRIRRLALAATACGWGSVPPTAEALALLAMPIRYHSPVLYWQTNHLLGPGDRDLLQRLPTLTESRLLFPPPLLGYAWQLAAGAMWSSLPWLSSVSAPTLILSGERDQITPAANGVQLARLLPQSRLHVVAGGGHLFLFDPEGEAVNLLAEFFESEAFDASGAWTTGRHVEHDDDVDAAFAGSPGLLPHRVFSDAYRRYVRVRANGHA